jgi:hypothetical protein
MNFSAKRIRIDQDDVNVAGRNIDCFIITSNDDPGELPSHIDLGIRTRPEYYHIDTHSRFPDIRVPTFAVIEVDGVFRTVTTSTSVPVQISTNNGVQERAAFRADSETVQAAAR